MSTHFAPFQHLYQQVKTYDPRLFDALNRVNGNFQNLYSLVNQQQSTTIQGISVSPFYFLITPVAGVATIDLNNGLNQRLVLGAGSVSFAKPIFTGGSLVAGLRFYLYVDQTGGNAKPGFTTGTGGFTTDFGNQEIDRTASTRSLYIASLDDNSHWIMDHFKTGMAIS